MPLKTYNNWQQFFEIKVIILWLLTEIEKCNCFSICTQSGLNRFQSPHLGKKTFKSQFVDVSKHESNPTTLLYLDLALFALR